MNTRVHELFPTPVIESTELKSQALIETLYNVIDKQRRADEGVQRSNIQCWHSKTDMLSWGGEAAADLGRGVISICGKHTALLGSSEGLNWRVEMWANRILKGGSNQLHAHLGAVWSAVYYVRVGKEQDDGDMGGDLRLLDPRFPGAYMNAPFLRPTWDENEEEYQQYTRDFSPCEGMLIAFPSWLMHSVVPYQGSGERISVAINLYC